MLLCGLALGNFAISAWGSVRFCALSCKHAARPVIPSGMMILLAFQIAYGAFFLSVLGIRSAHPPGNQSPQ